MRSSLTKGHHARPLEKSAGTRPVRSHPGGFADVAAALLHRRSAEGLTAVGRAEGAAEQSQRARNSATECASDRDAVADVAAADWGNRHIVHFVRKTAV